MSQHKVWRRPNGIFPSLPSGMDNVLKDHFDRFMEVGELPPELRENGLTDCKLFDDLELLKKWRTNLVGIQWNDPEGNLLRGAVDNILVKGDKLIVLDYKTRGYPLKADTAKHYQDQLNLYNFLLRKNGYETEDYGYLIFYHPDEVNKAGDVIFHKDLVKMDTNTSDAEKLYFDAIKLLKGECPQKTCEWCEGR